MPHLPITSKKQSTHGSPWKYFVISTCCILLLLVLSSDHSLAASAKIPMTANVLRIQLQTPPGGPVISIYDQSIINRLYRKMYQLPAYPQGRNCEEFRQGDVYTLTFYARRSIIARASVEKNGCHGLTLSKWDIRQPDQGFWNLFLQALDSGRAYA